MNQEQTTLKDVESISERIQRLKSERRAVILAHNYQRPEVQQLADITGDSLGLSRQAKETDAEVIVFCGVHFMAETASILSPEKTVLLPVLEAGCPMADMVSADDVRTLRAEHPEAVVVSYVNTSAAVKAESDICCTSANAVEVVQSIPESTPIIMVPDQYLGQHVAGRTKRDLILVRGYCPTHARIMDFHIEQARQQHPDAVVMAHPECTQPVRDAADEVLSTGGMSRFAQTSDATEFIVATETGMLHRLQEDNPDKRFYPVTGKAICPNMKRIRTQHVLWALEEMKHVISVPEAIRAPARNAIERMLEIEGSGG